MAEQIIDVGTAPNSGTGDPLRTAFIKTDNNFDQIWAAGPVGTNVRIQNNVISTLQVNQDLALSPNGVGNVRLNNNTIPGANNTWFLGSITNRWRGLFVGNVNAGNISISGNLTVDNGFVRTAQVTVSNLPTPFAGARSFVIDADTRTWGNLAVGNAANAVPVWADGSNWYIG
jgi:hypothetical protein